MNERIAITGYGCLTAAGNNLSSTWKAIKEGVTGIDKITLWDPSKWEYTLGGEIKNFSAEKFLVNRKLIKLLTRQDIIGLNAVSQALEHSNLLSYQASLEDASAFNNRTGVFVAASGIKFIHQYDYFPVFHHSEKDFNLFAEKLTEYVHPMWLLRALLNNVLAYTGIQYGFKGTNQNIINHGVSGIQAIIEAAQAIKNGTIDRAVVIGYDSNLEPETQMYYSIANLLSKNGLFPFHQNRDGTVLGEGAGSLILESFSSAKERNAIIYGEILGFSSSSEALGIFSIEHNGIGLIKCIQGALNQACQQTSDISLITPHGNGNINSDATEAFAIQQLFGKQTCVTGFKWALGHTIAAAGVIETILTLLALQEKKGPGIANLTELAKDCSGLNVSQYAKDLKGPIGLVVNRAFGGLNSCLVLKGNM